MNATHNAAAMPVPSPKRPSKSSWMPRLRTMNAPRETRTHFAAKPAIRSIGLAIVAFLALTGSAVAQGTVSPVARQQFFDNNGAPLAGGWLCAYEAGTNTLADTFTTSALNVANGNPLVLDAAGRATIFLSPGRSYKFVLKSPTTPVNCNTGTTIWSVDNVSAVPASSAALDVTGVAGQSIAAGDAVYLSTGAGALTAGQWYKMDADLVYASTGAWQVGIAPSAIASGASGTIRVAGAVTVTGPLTTGSAYYASATAGAITLTPPTNAIRMGQAESATSLVVGNFLMPVAPRGTPCGRLTLTSGAPVTVADVTAATTVYYTPYGGCNTVSTFDGVQWSETAFAQLSIAVPAGTNQIYDVFIYDNAGALALELTAWTNETTRATALTTQNGVYVKTGATTRLYLGSFRTTGVSGQTEDSFARRYLWNYYNRVPRILRVSASAGSWNYTLTAWQQAGASSTNQVSALIGVAEVEIDLTVMGQAIHSAGGVNAGVGIGEDSTTVLASGVLNQVAAPGTTAYSAVTATLRKYPAAGNHFYTWLEAVGAASGTMTWGGAVSALGQSGIYGTVWG